MTHLEADDVALKLLHTADWHLGRRFPSFEQEDQPRLTRARLEVLDRILRAADYSAVDAILCAGDLFDEPRPHQDWWQPVARKLAASTSRRPVFLLPGNHDPLQDGSVYHPSHPFRHALPSWVHVIDRDDFEHPLNEVSVLYARPCRSQAGQEDPALLLPARQAGDERIRIGLVHGSTFDVPDCQVNFPIARDAAVKRGLDYLAIGDTHSFRNVAPLGTPPVVYPGAPEATSFDEPGAGYVVTVFVTRARRVTFRSERVAAWTWAERAVSSLVELRALAAEPDLARTVLRLSLDLRLTAPELEEADGILRQLRGTTATVGRVGILQVAARRMELDSRDIERDLTDLPEVLQATVERLRALERGEQAEIARAALFHLYRLVRRREAR